MRCKWLLVALVAAACNNGLCSRHSDCPSGERCTISGACTQAAEDAAPAPMLDAGPDAVPLDAVPDAAPDGGP